MLKKLSTKLAMYSSQVCRENTAVFLAKLLLSLIAELCLLGYSPMLSPWCKKSVFSMISENVGLSVGY